MLVFLIFAFLIPVLRPVRKRTFAMTSGTRLSGIGKAILIYANENNGDYPSSFQELIDYCQLDPNVLVSPAKLEDFEGPSYIYITDQNSEMPSGNILAYENPGYCEDS